MSTLTCIPSMQHNSARWLLFFPLPLIIFPLRSRQLLWGTLFNSKRNQTSINNSSATELSTMFSLDVYRTFSTTFRLHMYWIFKWAFRGYIPIMYCTNIHMNTSSTCMLTNFKQHCFWLLQFIVKFGKYFRFILSS